jgi:hypothetical protein
MHEGWECAFPSLVSEAGSVVANALEASAGTPFAQRSGRMSDLASVTDFSRLSLNSATTKKWTLAEAVEGCVQAGIPAIGPWRDIVAEAGLAKAARLIQDAGPPGVIAVPGRLPHRARRRVADRLEDLVPFAEEHRIRLVLEPLHPMYAVDSVLISTLGQALDLAAPLRREGGGGRRRHFPCVVGSGVESADRTGRTGKPDSLLPGVRLRHPMAADALLSSGYMGNGVIDFATIGTWVRDSGYTGDIEVEIFSQEIWDTAGNKVLETVKKRYAQVVQPVA